MAAPWMPSSHAWPADPWCRILHDISSYGAIANSDVAIYFRVGVAQFGHVFDEGAGRGFPGVLDGKIEAGLLGRSAMKATSAGACVRQLSIAPSRPGGLVSQNFGISLAATASCGVCPGLGIRYTQVAK